MGGLCLLLSAGAQAQSDPPPLPEMTRGNADAPVTVIEYASLTCSYCARFHNETYERFLEDYVNTGKVHFIFREYPLDSLATLAAMLARCASDEGQDADRYFAFVDLLLSRQQQWASSRTAVEELKKVVRLGGMGEAAFEECRRNRAIFNGIKAIFAQGTRDGVSSTPTFFVNGEKATGALSYEALTALLIRHGVEAP